MFYSNIYIPIIMSTWAITIVWKSISDVLHDKMYLIRWNKSYVIRVNWDTHKQDFDFNNVYLHISLLKLKGRNQILNYKMKMNHAYIYRKKTWYIKIPLMSHVTMVTYDCYIIFTKVVKGILVLFSNECTSWGRHAEIKSSQMREVNHTVLNNFFLLYRKLNFYII